MRGGNDKKRGRTNKNVKTDDRKKWEGRRIIARVKSRNEYKEQQMGGGYGRSRKE